MKDHNIEPSQFTLALKIQGGHRYFWFKSPDYSGGFAGDALAIADNSGAYPHLTDDGLLLVNQITIHVAPRSMNGQALSGTGASIPLIDMEGNTSSTPCSVYEAFAVARLLGLDVEIHEVEGWGRLPIKVSIHD